MWAQYLKITVLVTACVAMAGCASSARSTAGNTFDIKLTPVSVSDSKPVCTYGVSTASQEIKVTNLTRQTISQVSVDCDTTQLGIEVADPSPKNIPGRQTRTFICTTKDIADPPDGTIPGTKFKLEADVDGQKESWDISVVCTTQETIHKIEKDTYQE